MALQDLGMLEGKRAEEAREIVANYMRVADSVAFARGEGISFEAFCKFYETLVMAKARQQLRFKLGLQVEEDLRTTFLCFAGYGSREVRAERLPARTGKGHSLDNANVLWAVVMMAF